MKSGLLVFCLLCVTGCMRYEPQMPEPVVPAAWKEYFPYDCCFPEKNRFWQLFEDSFLNELEEKALAANFDLKIAVARILQARSIALKDYANRLPKVNLNTTLKADETLLNPRSFGSPIKYLERVTQQQYSLLAGFSYELDFWGKLKDKQESACYRLQASEWDYEFVYQNLVTEVALHYFALRTLEEELEFLEQTIFLLKETVGLKEYRVEAGLDFEIDLYRAKLELALAEAEIEQARWHYINEENALATLIAQPASCWKASPGHLPKQLPPLPLVVPSEVLLRRADIQAALALVSSGRADIDVALKSYFPSFPLTAGLGLASPFLSNFFQGEASYWGYTLNMVQYLFDGGQRRADVQIAKAQFLERFATYQKTVNQSFMDVEEALSALHYTNLQLIAQTEARDAAVDTFYLAKERWNSGLISYLLVADSEHTSIIAQRKLITLKGQKIMNWIRLMRALGLQPKDG